MNEYIKKEDAREAIRETCRNLNYLTPPVSQLTTAIDKVPSADVIEVKHSKNQIMNKDKNLAKLVHVGSYAGYCEVKTYICSNCDQYTRAVRTQLDNGDIVLPKYCPNCGAKMNEEGQEHE